MAGREKSAERMEAARLYAQSGKGRGVLKEIAAQLGKSESLIRKWKNQDGWDNSGDETVTLPNVNGNVTESEPEPRAQSPPPSPVDLQIAAAVEENDELTSQQKDFCVYFTRNRNATQAYLKAYGCSYATANVNGPRLLVNARVANELRELQRIKNAALGGLCGDDVVELHMRIAFADLTDFVEYRNVNRPILYNGKPIQITDPQSGEPIVNPDTGQPAYLSYSTNDVKFRPSDQIDGQLIAEVSQGRDGGKIKLRNQDASMKFLERYFALNPLDVHRMEFDARKLEVELMKIQAGLPPTNDETGSTESNFNDALKAAAAEVWDDEGHS